MSARQSTSAASTKRRSSRAAPGSSQCGQTVGAALVVDQSKHPQPIGAFDREAMTIEVEPGVVLDQLNAYLRPHGLWFPVDVSTSAQATLGGMAGNNSCGSRSIAYGNMVHNVLALDAILSDGTEARFASERAMTEASPRVAALLRDLAAIGARERAEIERNVPKVLRRVGGYNIDVFNPQSVRPYATSGEVNYAQLSSAARARLRGRAASCSSSRRCRRTACSASSTSRRSSRRWSARSTS
jgi:hypothetical protein